MPEADWQAQPQCATVSPVFPEQLQLDTHKENFEEMTEATKIYLSRKKIPPRERLILALDVPTIAEAKKLVTRLGDSVVFYKLGLQLFMTGGYFNLAKWLHDRKKKVLVDLKFFDVPETVRLAMKQLKKWRAQFVTVHGNDESLRAAVTEKNGIKYSRCHGLNQPRQLRHESYGFRGRHQNRCRIQS